MGLSTSGSALKAALNWTLQNVVLSPYNPANESDTVSYQYPFPAGTLSICAGLFSNSFTVDLYSFTDLSGATVSGWTKLYAMILAPTGAGAIAKLIPGATHGLTWYWTGTGPILSVPAGGMEVHADVNATVLSTTVRTIDVTNSGSGTLGGRWAFLVGA